VRSIEQLAEIVGEDMQKVEHQLTAAINSQIAPVKEICTYVVGTGGKRLRPLILLLAARFSGYAGRDHITLACALEYIHTATLLHDDVIDHAEIRRGNSTANRLWGNQMTVLAGDFFLSRAFSMAVESKDMRVLEVIAQASRCMAESEIFEVSKSGDPLTTEEEYFFIVRNKTASLIAAAARIGGILGQVDGRCEQALEDYGLNLGIAFQIMDDILDYYSTEKDFGKTIGKDLQEGSMTLPFIAALSRSNPEERSRMIEIMLSKRRGKRELSQVIKLIEKLQGQSYAREQAAVYVRRAIEALGVFDENGKKQPLLDLAEYVLNRRA
jgi:octaprenyl-diphosphate synthase